MWCFRLLTAGFLWTPRPSARAALRRSSRLHARERQVITTPGDPLAHNLRRSLTESAGGGEIGNIKGRVGRGMGCSLQAGVAFWLGHDLVGLEF